MAIYAKQNLGRSSHWAWRFQHVALAFICFQKHSIVLATSGGILVLLDDARDSQLYEGRLLDESNASERSSLRPTNFGGMQHLQQNALTSALTSCVQNRRYAQNTTINEMACYKQFRLGRV
jgi:hypothetical protein